MDMNAILIEEIERSADLVASDDLLRRPLQRVRVIAARGQWMVEFDRNLLLELAGADAASAERHLGLLIGHLAVFVQIKEATDCVYCTAHDLPDHPRTIIALAIDRAARACRCVGQQLLLGSPRLGPVRELAIEDVPEGTAIARRLMGDSPAPDETSKQLLEEVLRQGLLQVIPEDQWLTGKGRVLN